MSPARALQAESDDLESWLRICILLARAAAKTLGWRHDGKTSRNFGNRS